MKIGKLRRGNAFGHVGMENVPWITSTAPNEMARPKPMRLQDTHVSNAQTARPEARNAPEACEGVNRRDDTIVVPVEELDVALQDGVIAAARTAVGHFL